MPVQNIKCVSVQTSPVSPTCMSAQRPSMHCVSTSSMHCVSTSSNALRVNILNALRVNILNALRLHQHQLTKKKKRKVVEEKEITLALTFIKVRLLDRTRPIKTSSGSEIVFFFGKVIQVFPGKLLAMCLEFSKEIFGWEYFYKSKGLIPSWLGSWL